MDANSVSGWACDPDQPSQSLQIHLYEGNPYTSSSSVLITAVVADQSRSDLASYTTGPCKGTTNHGYTIKLQNNPAVMSKIGDGKPHTLYVFAVNVGAGLSNPYLVNSGKSITLNPVVTGQNPIGVVDVVNSSSLSGWACDLDNPNQSIGVEIYDGAKSTGGRLLTTVVANGSRSDLAPICGNTTAHGFSVSPLKTPEIANIVFDSTNVHMLRFYAVNIGGGTTTELTGSGKYITTPLPTNPSPVGYLDIVTPTNIAGWACDMSVPNRSVQIALLVSDPVSKVTIGSQNIIASSTRSDLVSVCGGTTLHGFSLNPSTNSYWSSKLLPGKTYEVRASAINVLAPRETSNPTGQNTSLINSPKTLTMPTTAPPPPSGTNTVQVIPVTSSLGAGNSVTLSWAKTTGALSYGIYFDDTLLDKTTATTYTIKPGVLVSDTTYDFSVAAVSSTTPPEILSSNSTNPAPAVVTTQPAPAVKTVSGPGSIFTPVTAKILAVIVDAVYTGGALVPLSIPENTETVDEVEAKLFTDPKSTRAFYKENSYGKFDITGDVARVSVKVKDDFPNTNVDEKNILKYLKYFTLINNTLSIEGYDISKYDNLIYIFPPVSGSALAGFAFFELKDVWIEKKGVMWINSVQPISVYSHEFGHRLGIEHGLSTLRSNCFNNNDNSRCYVMPYGDNYNVMGDSFRHFNTYAKNKLGWVGSQEITTSGKYNIPAKADPNAKSFTIAKTDTGDVYNLGYQGSDSVFDNVKSDGFLITLIKKTSSPGYNPSGKIIDDLKNNSIIEFIPYAVGNISLDKKNKFKIISLKNDFKSADVFVRFDPTYNLKAEAGTNTGEIKVSWDAVSLAAGYQLYRDSTSTPAIYNGTSTYYLDKNLTVGKTYKYYVRAYDKFPEMPNQLFDMPYSEPVSSLPGTSQACYGTITPNITAVSGKQTGAVSYFGNGTIYPAGLYQIKYAGGSRYYGSPQKFGVHFMPSKDEYRIDLADSSNARTPRWLGITQDSLYSYPTYTIESALQTAQNGKSMNIQMYGQGKIGMWLDLYNAGSSVTSAGPSGAPKFELCKVQ
jgi:M6 family metalloprotease-like protein